MDHERLQPSFARVWKLAQRQHGAVTRAQLLAFDLSSDAIKNRIAGGRLHPIARGVYAVGRPQLDRHGQWMAAMLSCGPQAVLSHLSAAALWEISTEPSRQIDVPVPARVCRRRPGVVVHRREGLAAKDLTTRRGIPVITPVCTIIDIAPRLRRAQLERAINEADKRGLTNPEALRDAVATLAGRPGRELCVKPSTAVPSR